MNIPRGVAALGLLIGFAALVRALLMLDEDPFLAVLAMLAAMAVLLGSAARFCSGEGKEPVRSMEDRSTF